MVLMGFLMIVIGFLIWPPLVAIALILWGLSLLDR